MSECDYNDHNQKNQCKNNPKPKLQVVCEYFVNIRIHKKYTKYTEKIRKLSALSDLNQTTSSKLLYVMAPRQHIEWDPEEVAAGYDLSSIYEGVDDNSTAPVISSVVNASPAFNITAGLGNLVKEVAEQVVKMVTNTTNTASNTTINPITMAPTTVVPFNSSPPSTISTIVKKVVEHLSKEQNIPVMTVCICFFFVKQFIQYITVLYSTILTVYYRTVFYTFHHTVYNTVHFF